MKFITSVHLGINSKSINNVLLYYIPNLNAEFDQDILLGVHMKYRMTMSPYKSIIVELIFS